MTVARWSFAALLLLLTLVFLNSPGTGDVDIWGLWAERAETLGPVRGFAANEADYPPLASGVLLLAVRGGRALGLDPLLGIKLFILIFHVACTLVVLRWTRSLAVAAAFHATVFLSAVAHGFLDIFAALPFLLSLWALRERRLTPFAVLFALAALLKWQPLIIAPFIAIHVIAITRRPGGAIDVAVLLRRVIAPALAILAVILLFFGAAPTFRALAKGLNHEALSANALNLNWIVTHLLLVLDPRYGGLEEGRANWIRMPPPSLMVAARVVFLLAYAATLWAYLRRDKAFERLLKFGLLGFLCYFMLNAGVHENHLFLASVLAVLLVWLKPDEFWPALVIVLMSNINLLLFYGLNGSELGFKRVIEGRFDMALPIAIVNVIFFGWYWTSEVWRPGGKSVATHPAAG